HLLTSHTHHTHMATLFHTLLFHAHAAHPALHSFPTRRSSDLPEPLHVLQHFVVVQCLVRVYRADRAARTPQPADHLDAGSVEHRSEEHTSELQSRSDLVCRLLLEKKNKMRETSRTRVRCRQAA